MNDNTLHDSFSDSARRRTRVDVPTVATELGMTQRFIRRLVAEGRVPFLKIGKFIRFDPQEIDRWIDEAMQPTAHAQES